ncbi:MAG: glycosyltransferase [Lachnospiraceae bacterium]|nr:glycosyltransferase [Lachnospiraceae bacterium]
MKLLSVCVPCYNSEAYMSNCIEGLVKGGDRVEVIVVDDGSKDSTAAIADEFQKKYPSIVKAVHQPNKGHGGAVNTGLDNATGIFFKVVDSDDHLEPEAYQKVLDRLESLVMEETRVDMFVCNYVYDKVGAKHKKVMNYRKAFPVDEVFGWEASGRLGLGKYILMHSVIYQTDVLRRSNLRLPEHTFYVDNLFVYAPLSQVKKLYYMDVDLYMYYIGREDQSVNEKVMITRLDQQLTVNRLMIDAYDIKSIKDRHLRSYLLNYLEIITTISSVFAILSGDDENLRKKEEIWSYMKEKDPYAYAKIRYGAAGRVMNLPGKVGRKLSVAAYKVSQRLYGFN